MNEFAKNSNYDSRPTEPKHDLSILFREQSEIYNNPTLKEAGVAVVDALTSQAIDADQLRQVWVEYTKVAEAAVDSIEDVKENPKLRAKAQVAMIIHKALLFQSAGNTVRYLEELDIAETYAFNAGLDEVSEVLSDEIHTKVEQLSVIPEILILKLKGLLSENNRDFLKEQLIEGIDLEDLIGQVYGMLIDEGEDPNEILVKIGITEQ